MIRRFMVIALLAVSLFVSGCTSLDQWWNNGCKVGPNYEPPCAPAAGDWIDSGDSRVVQTVGDDGLCEWWSTFHDPELDLLIQTARAENLDLQKAQCRIQEARATRDMVAGNLLPQAQAVGGLVHGQIGKNLTQGAFPNVFNLWADGLALSWELDFWGRVRRQVESANATFDASLEDYRNVELLLLADVATNYVLHCTFQERLKFAQNNIEIQRETLKIALSKYQNDSASELDAHQAQSNLSQTEAIVPELKTGLRQAENRIAILLGRPPGELALRTDSFGIPAAPREVSVGIPADLLRRRPDIRRTEREVAAQAAQIGVAEADLYPRFSLIGFVGDSGNNFSDLFKASSFTGLVLPVVQWKILNYTRVRNGIEVQQARFEQKVLDYRQTVLTANCEVEDALVAFLQALEQGRHLRVGVEAAERSVAVVLSQYREGTTNFSRVLEAQQQLTKQQDQLATAQQSAAISLIRVYKGLGGGWSRQ